MLYSLQAPKRSSCGFQLDEFYPEVALFLLLYPGSITLRPFFPNHYYGGFSFCSITFSPRRTRLQRCNCSHRFLQHISPDLPVKPPPGSCRVFEFQPRLFRGFFPSLPDPPMIFPPISLNLTSRLLVGLRNSFFLGPFRAVVNPTPFSQDSSNFFGGQYPC